MKFARSRVWLGHWQHGARGRARARAQGTKSRRCRGIRKHLPGFVEKAAEFKAKVIYSIACVSVNNGFVMKAWKADLKIGDEVLLLSDSNGRFTRAIGCQLDLSDKSAGLGVRSKRYAIYIEDGVVKVLNLEQGGDFSISSAEDLLKAI
ncbi:Peroxiredoxin-2E- chloroplastic [Striga hermonthica]|uniref:Glutaredoxin-dependent peroxiredoxin n=1 Tax=Striga hermonthica TaxID=68872 RepID=A0A9N7NZW0_STRHE|nr:Peroxiredoxin-2E- chloroplastic [Striga hermonthica]